MKKRTILTSWPESRERARILRVKLKALVDVIEANDFVTSSYEQAVKEAKQALEDTAI